MGFEPRAAQRLRLAVLSSNGALNDIAHLIGEPADGQVEDALALTHDVVGHPSAPGRRRQSVA